MRVLEWGEGFEGFNGLRGLMVERLKGLRV